MNKQDFLNKLTHNRPSIFEQYNYDDLPETFLATNKIPITCLKHGLFHQLAHAHLSGNSCIKCMHERCGIASRVGTEAFVKRSRDKFKDWFTYEKTDYTGINKHLTVTCPEHGEYIVLPKVHLASLHGCIKCNDKVRRSAKCLELIEIAKKTHGDKYDYSKVNYINPYTTVEIICPTHGSFWQYLFTHCNSTCPKCAVDNNRMSLDTFLTRAEKVHDNKYLYDNVKYTDCNDMISITCKVHGDFMQLPRSHLEGSGCKMCFLEQRQNQQSKTTPLRRIIEIFF